LYLLIITFYTYFCTNCRLPRSSYFTNDITAISMFLFLFMPYSIPTESYPFRTYFTSKLLLLSRTSFPRHWLLSTAIGLSSRMGFTATYEYGLGFFSSTFGCGFSTTVGA
jgi:ABC-type multidrug transport system permease subunit